MKDYSNMEEILAIVNEEQNKTIEERVAELQFENCLLHAELERLKVTKNHPAIKAQPNRFTIWTKLVKDTFQYIDDKHRNELDKVTVCLLAIPEIFIQTKYFLKAQ